MALPCETYLDSNSWPYVSVPDCCYWSNPCLGCPWLLSGKPTTTTQCIAKQFQHTLSGAATCPACSAGYANTSGNNICCWTSDAFDFSNYCSTVSACVCGATQTHAIPNPMMAPPSTGNSPLQCVTNCKSAYGDGYYQLAGNTCVAPLALSNACPLYVTNSLGSNGTARTLIQDAVCDVALNLTSVNGSSTVANELTNAIGSSIEANKAYKLASYLVWVGVALILLGIWGNKKYLTSIV